MSETTHPNTICAPRDCLLAFACDMEKELRENDHKDGWGDLSHAWILNRIKQEYEELRRAVETGRAPEIIISECADVANFCMMLADNIKDGKVP